MDPKVSMEVAIQVGHRLALERRPAAGWLLGQEAGHAYLRPALQRSMLAPGTVLIGRTMGQSPWGFRLQEDVPAHLSISGPPGCGKSELLRSCLVSLCWSTSPRALGVVGIDPAGQQLGMIDCLPHAMLEPVVELRRARALLAWLVDEAKQRRRFAGRGRKLVVAVEDLSQWKETARLEASLAWLRRWGGAVGIHVLQVATSGDGIERPFDARTWHVCGGTAPGQFMVSGRDGVHPIQALWLPVRDLVACIEEIRQSAWLAGVDGSAPGSAIR